MLETYHDCDRIFTFVFFVVNVLVMMLALYIVGKDTKKEGK